MAEVKKDVSQLKIDVAELKRDVSQLKIDAAELKRDVTQLKLDVSELKKDVTEMRDTLKDVKYEFKLNDVKHQNYEEKFRKIEAERNEQLKSKQA
jgi:chromosome segregation ATPase